MWLGPSSLEISSLTEHPGPYPLMGFWDKRPWRGVYAIGTDFDIAEDGSFHLFACRTKRNFKGSLSGEPVALNADEMEYMIALYGSKDRPNAYSTLISDIEAVARRFAEESEGGC